MRRTRLTKIQVRIISLSDIPPKYFLMPGVINALKREIAEDITKGRSVPAGVEVVRTLSVKGSQHSIRDFAQGMVRDLRGQRWPILITGVTAGAVTALILIVWRSV